MYRLYPHKFIILFPNNKKWSLYPICRLVLKYENLLVLKCDLSAVPILLRGCLGLQSLLCPSLHSSHALWSLTKDETESMSMEFMVFLKQSQLQFLNQSLHQSSKKCPFGIT